ncbi:hypothetical protein SDC9_151629 [bioreactor metagenome]|uniref:Uncharacterized protein n=1 Tax=bioreactor metagenome TaxID=1076179 RepID=A0A645EQU3_9ZZZZ
MADIERISVHAVESARVLVHNHMRLLDGWLGVQSHSGIGQDARPDRQPERSVIHDSGD